uniref:Uncharacterized protein n=1 Tax=Fagus sylvatica TaxID=28930 RepID=A0A2N9GG87_FAGSY
MVPISLTVSPDVPLSGIRRVTWASDLSSRWCSFAVVPGLRNKLRGGAGLRRSEADLSLSPNVARDGTDPSLSRWRFVVGQDVVAGGCVAVTVGFVGEWWLAVVAGGCAYRWLWSRPRLSLAHSPSQAAPSQATLHLKPLHRHCHQ